jgi:hypothetical protein
MYSLKDLYPDLAGLNTTEKSIPERAEQASYEQTDEVAPAPVPKAGNLWMSLLVILVLLWLFNII